MKAEEQTMLTPIETEIERFFSLLSATEHESNKSLKSHINKIRIKISLLRAILKFCPEISLVGDNK